MDENKEVNSTDPKREKVRVIPLSAIDDAPDHPFQVRDDDEMAELVESISTFGVINPVIVRKGEGERYELISGHRRKYACAKLGIDTLPVIVRDLSREEAIIFMVDSNLHREHILPSERAKAYKMKLLFADKLPHATQSEGITGGYLFSFNVECVDESGNLLKTQKFTGNGTLWSFEPPEVDGYTTTCASITRDDITNWRYPASHYVREANGSIRVVYSPIGS